MEEHVIHDIPELLGNRSHADLLNQGNMTQNKIQKFVGEWSGHCGHEDDDMELNSFP